jgi:hypothetical protein
VALAKVILPVIFFTTDKICFGDAEGVVDVSAATQIVGMLDAPKAVKVLDLLRNNAL